MKYTGTSTRASRHVYRAVRRCFRWGGGGGKLKKVGGKPLDKGAQGGGLGGDFRLLPCRRRNFSIYVLRDNSS